MSTISAVHGIDLIDFDDKNDATSKPVTKYTPTTKQSSKNQMETLKKDHKMHLPSTGNSRLTSIAEEARINTTESLNEQSPSNPSQPQLPAYKNFEAMKKLQMCTALSYMITITAVIASLEGVYHLVMNMNGGLFQRMQYPLVYLITLCVVHESLKRDWQPRFISANAVFIMNFVMIIMLSEHQIFLNPNQMLVTPM